MAKILAKALISGTEEFFILPDHLPWGDEYSSIYESLSDGMPFHGTIASIASERHDASFATITMIPVFIRSYFWGVLAFCFQRERPPFETDEIDVLRAAAYNMAASVIRWESEREVKKGYENSGGRLRTSSGRWDRLSGRRTPILSSIRSASPRSPWRSGTDWDWERSAAKDCASPDWCTISARSKYRGDFKQAGRLSHRV